jgi:CheY-like chemotaxis protein
VEGLAVSGTGMNIVVVADEHDLIFYLSNLLKTYGFKTLVAGQWNEALSTAKIKRPGLVVMDAMLPGHIVQQAYSNFRQHDIFRNVPVLMLSSLTRRSLSRFCISLAGGMKHRFPEPEAVLPRPPEADEFIAAVRKLCVFPTSSKEKKKS